MCSNMIKCILVWIICVPSIIHGDEQCSLDGPISINPNADVKFTVITSLRVTSGISCGGAVSVAALQNLGVMQWIVDKMNRENFTGDVDIGKWSRSTGPIMYRPHAVQILSN